MSKPRKPKQAILDEVLDVTRLNGHYLRPSCGRVGRPRLRALEYLIAAGVLIEIPGDARGVVATKYVFAKEKSEKGAAYNWQSVGPGGCDTHCIEHPCGPCITGRNKRSA